MSKIRLLSSGLFSLIEKVITVLAMLILTPSIIESIGNEGYGLWLLILSVLAFFNIIELGFPAAVQRFVTLYLEKGDRDTANLYLTTSLFLFLSLGVISAFVALLVFQFPHLLGLEADMDQLLTKVAAIFAVKIVVDFSMNPINAIYAAHLRVDIDAALATLNVIVKSTLIYFVGRHFGIVTMALCAVFTDIFINLLKIIAARKIYPYWCLKRKYISYNGFLELFNFSKYIIIMAFAKMINQRSAPILISNIMTVNSVAIFGVAQNLINHAETLNNSIFQSFSAYFTKLVARGGELKNHIDTIARMCFLCCLTLAINLIVFSDPFIRIWLGPSFNEASALISIMALGLLVRPYAMIFRNILIAQANHKNLMYASLIGSIFTILLSIALGKIYGVIGVALAFVLVSYLVNFILYRIAFKRHNKIALVKLDICFAVSASVFFVLWLVAREQLILPTTWASLILSAIIFNAFFVPTLAYFFIPKEIMSLMFSTIKRKL
ncbi:oligosaccharide flippase family protein [Alteromonas sp. PRIM-21]|uniref:oligosaccharide flippase family protein n=1 Tax=Alteromonas sp. PRIM-21 TaxID=1454978 RepID=UPI0022B99517|nr:oligosaccharide flippase family protein [Alteromonas sp. PRIM-21]MCZ8529765.1 oligosaccharide flippase family protein [Alteromonas sp. PRIM-21]